MEEGEEGHIASDLHATNALFFFPLTSCTCCVWLGWMGVLA